MLGFSFSGWLPVRRLWRGTGGLEGGGVVLRGLPFSCWLTVLPASSAVAILSGGIECSSSLSIFTALLVPQRHSRQLRMPSSNVPTPRKFSSGFLNHQHTPAKQYHSHTPPLSHKDQWSSSQNLASKFHVPVTLSPPLIFPA